MSDEQDTDARLPGRLKPSLVAADIRVEASVARPAEDHPIHVDTVHRAFG